MRVLLTTYGSRGKVQPLVGLAMQVRALSAVLPVGVGVPQMQTGVSR